MSRLSHVYLEKGGTPRLRRRPAAPGRGSTIFDVSLARPAVLVSVTRPTAADGAEFVERARASAELHHPWVTPPTTAAQYDTYLRRVQQTGFSGYLARRQEDGALVGYFTLGHIVRDALQSAYLGYAGFVPYTGRGYMSEAMQQVLDDAFGRLQLHRVEANIQPANAPSIALARRTGFQLEGFSPAYLRIGGEWRDHERWAIRADTWAELSASR